MKIIKIDEVVRKAETKYDIDYIKYPSFSRREGKNCVQVLGERYRIAK
ncbi:MAG: hypothetical protein H7061_03855 [Bdellovibrionaceae bacterium]|nr:hypothetical protein [Bdellovibrio sp.]